MISLTEEASRERPDFPVLTHRRTFMDPPEKPENDEPDEQDATPLEKDKDPDDYILPGCPD